jgi:uncharacterized delta-60 repeat protein
MWFRTPHKRRSAAPARHRASHRPRLELLEDRCLLSAGQLDTTFGSGGIVTTLIGTSANAYATALQSDGKILAAGIAGYTSGNRFALARYTTSGSLDTSFGSGGTVTTKIGSGTGYGARGVAVQSDGKIVLAGAASFKAGTEFALARYTTSGALDTSFGSKGIVSTQLGSGDIAYAEVIQPDGKIIAAGTSNQGGAGHTVPNDFALVRYNSDGSLDTSFGSGGEVLTAFPGEGQTSINGITLQSDGKIVVAGDVGPGPGDAGEQFTVARYNTNGTLDTSFGGTGIVIVPSVTGAFTEYATSVVVQSDGKIVATGDVGLSGHGNWETIRFNTDGTLDSTFGSGGSVTTLIGSGGVAYSLALQSDGKIVVGGNPYFSLARFNTDGSLDTTFNTTGTVTTQIGTGSNAKGVVIQPTDGKIVVAGDATVGGTSNFAVARYLGSSTTAVAAAARTTSAADQAAADAFWADMRAVSILLSNEDTKKH